LVEVQKDKIKAPSTWGAQKGRGILPCRERANLLLYDLFPPQAAQEAFTGHSPISIPTYGFPLTVMAVAADFHRIPLSSPAMSLHCDQNRHF